jgi:Uma2 family endonuclease
MLGPASGPTIVLQPDGVEIPPGITSLGRFLEWARSEAFPQRGRIDWLGGRLEVDMSPEDVNTHASPKSAIAARLVVLVQETQQALVCIDSTRVSSREADLSSEPDILVLYLGTLESGRARLVPAASRKEGRYVEVEGSPDLAVECVSDSSVVKDRKSLRDLYHKAGVREYWIADVRGEVVEFEVLHYRKDGYVAAPMDSRGFQHSEVLQRGVRLTRVLKAGEIVFYRLDVAE